MGILGEPNKIVRAKKNAPNTNKVAVKVNCLLLLVLMNDHSEANILLRRIYWVIDCLVGAKTRTMLFYFILIHQLFSRLFELWTCRLCERVQHSNGVVAWHSSIVRTGTVVWYVQKAIWRGAKIPLQNTETENTKKNKTSNYWTLIKHYTTRWAFDTLFNATTYSYTTRTCV